MSDTVRVLVVDDAAFMRRTLVKLLGQAPGVEVVGEARDGREAVGLFGTTRPDVVCLDIDMPTMDGITALKHFMATRPTPVIVVSSMTDRENVPFELFRLGVIDFFPKPTSLVGAVENQTRLLLQLVRNAKTIRVENLLRVPLHPDVVAPTVPDRLRHLLVVAGGIGSVGPLLRFLSLLPPRIHRGIGMLCLVPLHEAISASFRDSVGRLFGWEAECSRGPVSLRAGKVCLLKPGSRWTFLDRSRCRMEEEIARPIDELLSGAGRAMGHDATLVLLAGSEPAGVEGLAEAQAAGSHCYVQDPESALFATWQPQALDGVRLLNLETIATRIVEQLASPPPEREAAS